MKTIKEIAQDLYNLDCKLNAEPKHKLFCKGLEFIQEWLILVAPHSDNKITLDGIPILGAELIIKRLRENGIEII